MVFVDLSAATAKALATSASATWWVTTAGSTSRRSAIAAAAPDTYGSRLTIDRKAARVRLDGEEVSLAPKEYGLLSRVTEKGKAVDAALELAERIAKNAPLSVAASKTIVRNTQGMTDEEAWEYQKPFVRSVFSSEDAKEGPKAFAEKRAPSWSGR